MDKEPELLRQPAWTLADVGKSLIGFVLVLVAGRVLFAGVLRVSNLPAAEQTLMLFAVTYGLLVVLVWYFAIVKYGGRARDLGLRGFDAPRGLMSVIIWLVGVRVAVILYGIIAAAVGALFGAKPPTELTTRVPDLFGYGLWGVVLAVAVAGLVGPAVEEIFFRGFLYPALRNVVGVGWAIALSAVVFGVFHVSPWLFVPTTLMGVALAYLYERQGSLWPSIMLHGLSNLLSIVLVYALM